MEYSKLVRDYIPRIIESTGGTYECRIADAQEFELALFSKLNEEATEVSEAFTIHDLEAELADLREVYLTILALKNISEERIEQVRLQKLEERGGFQDRIILIRA